jgi:GNAT superfamily N-acetyltransferase
MQNPGGPIGISDIVDIVAIEHAGFAALPPEHHLEDGLWVLRMAGGLAKRANSANPRAPGAELDAARLARIEAVYRSAGLPVILRINPLAAPEADALLVAHGYQFVDDCRVMTARLAPAAGTAPAPMPDGIVTTADTTIPDFWHDTFAQLDGLDAHGRATRRAMLDALDRPHAAITLRDVSGEVLGIGLAVRDGAHVGLFDVRVAPAARGRGLGRAVRVAMLDWARAQGIADAPLTAYLQVGADNVPAVSLYRSLGFADAYAYHYRIGPA